MLVKFMSYLDQVLSQVFTQRKRFLALFNFFLEMVWTWTKTKMVLQNILMWQILFKYICNLLLFSFSIFPKLPPKLE